MKSICILSLYCIGIMSALAQENTSRVKLPQNEEGLRLYVEHIYNEGYIINDNYLIYQDEKSRKIIHPDMKTFQLVSRLDDKTSVAQDKNGVYYKGKFFPSDSTGFYLINSVEKPVADEEFSSDRDYIWKTNRKVYLNTEEITGADPQSFKGISYVVGLYHIDKNYLYYYGKRVKGADVQSIRPSYTCRGVVADKNNTYYQGKIFTYKGESLKQIAANIFKTPHYALAYKTKSIYANKGEFVELPKYVDVLSLKGLSETYVMDNKNVYYVTERNAEILAIPIKIENSKKIRAFNGYITDGKSVFQEQKKINLDARTFGLFRLCEGNYLYDKKGIYKESDKLERIPFDYRASVEIGKNVFLLDDFIIYGNQVYDKWEDKVHTLTKEQIEEVKKGEIYPPLLWEETSSEFYPRNADKATFEWLYDRFETVSLAKDKNRVYLFNDERLSLIEGYDDMASLKPTFHGLFLKDKSYVYYLDTRLIKSDKAELLASYRGERKNGLDDYCTEEFDYYLLKNVQGFWLVKIGENIFIEFLGAKLKDFKL